MFNIFTQYVKKDVHNKASMSIFSSNNLCQNTFFFPTAPGKLDLQWSYEFKKKFPKLISLWTVHNCKAAICKWDFETLIIISTDQNLYHLIDKRWSSGSARSSLMCIFNQTGRVGKKSNIINAKSPIQWIERERGQNNALAYSVLGAKNKIAVKLNKAGTRPTMRP